MEKAPFILFEVDKSSWDSDVIRKMRLGKKEVNINSENQEREFRTCPAGTSESSCGVVSGPLERSCPCVSV